MSQDKMRENLMRVVGQRMAFDAWMKQDAPDCKEARTLAFAAWQASAALQSAQAQQSAIDVDALANEIRRVDGSHVLGAGALAEALIPFLSAQAQQDAMDAERWLVFNIGCIECGVSSNVFGRFSTEDEAKAIAATCEASLGWREGGQNSF